MFNKNETDILVAGHRGIKHLFPENTMLSYKEAINIGVDMIELDINMTKDNELVLCHDLTVDRTTNGKGHIRDYLLSELKKLDAGNVLYPNQQIPTFKEFLELIKGSSIFLNVEIKDKDFAVVDKTIKLLEEYNMKNEFVIACFDASIIEYAYNKYHVLTQGFPEELMDNFTEKTNSTMYSVGIPLNKLNSETVDYYLKLGIVPWAWCPDSVDDVLKCVKNKVRLVTSNNPAIALDVLRRIGLHK